MEPRFHQGDAAVHADGDVYRCRANLRCWTDQTPHPPAFGAPSFRADDQILDVVYLRAQAVHCSCWTFNASTGIQVGDVQGETPTGARDYNIWFLDLMAHRPIFNEHWALDAGYHFRTQEADDIGIDYDQHRFTVGISFAF